MNTKVTKIKMKWQVGIILNTEQCGFELKLGQMFVTV